GVRVQQSECGSPGVRGRVRKTMSQLGDYLHEKYAAQLDQWPQMEQVARERGVSVMDLESQRVEAEHARIAAAAAPLAGIVGGGAPAVQAALAALAVPPPEPQRAPWLPPPAGATLTAEEAANEQSGVARLVRWWAYRCGTEAGRTHYAEVDEPPSWFD